MAFLKYAASIEPTAVVHQSEARNVPLKKTIKAVVPDFMTEAAVKALLGQPDASTAKGTRDRFLMILLYDTGARIQEILSARISDFRLGSTPTMTVMGKGSKPRVVPIMSQTVEHLSEYLKIFHAGESPYSNDPLFYVMRQGKKTAMSVANAERLIKRYGDDARTICPDVPENVHPHLFRHSRAMHLYQHGMDLTLIAQWLGHANLNITTIYAYADTEKKRAAIALAMDDGGQIFDAGSSSRYQIDNEDALKKLYGLR
jgi:site-specific recombinase XerD